MDDVILQAALDSHHEDMGVQPYLRRRHPEGVVALRTALLEHFPEAIVDANGKLN